MVERLCCFRPHSERGQSARSHRDYCWCHLCHYRRAYRRRHLHRIQVSTQLTSGTEVL